MKTSKSFPIPIPSLTRVYSLDMLSSAREDLDSFLSQFISLVILTDFPGEPIPKLLEEANRLCLDLNAHSQQRVLWIPKKELQNAVKSDIEVAIKAGFPNKAVIFDNVAALSLAPASGKAAYLMYKNTALSRDPEDELKELSHPQMKRAFSSAILNMPKTPQ